ncbi:MAG TPA: transposase [Terriglobales bacterium]|nr:transposase [Terriglobales bacterium]
MFYDDRDRREFTERAATVVEKGGFRVFAWSLLPNHFHLIVQSGVLGLSVALQALLGGYARYFNRRHNRCGHLFQNRFGSTVVQSGAYLLELIRYVHLNPLRARLVTDLDALDHYEWAGHRALIGASLCDWQASSATLALFGPTVRQARSAYRRFLRDGVAEATPWQPPSVGLRRRRDGIELVKQLDRGRERWTFDERCLGTDEFEARLRRELELREARRKLLNQRPAINLDSLERSICQILGVSYAELRSGSKRREIVAARMIFAWLAVELMGVTPAAVAARLRVVPRSVERLVRVGQSKAKELGLNPDAVIESVALAARRESLSPR